MSILSDTIELFIKEMLEEEGSTNLQRNELAQQFNCAPSQINYVLTTRFTPNRGYYTESKRGGGGYIRVVRVNVEKGDYIADLIEKSIGDTLSERQSRELVQGLIETDFIDEPVKEVINAALSDRTLEGDARLRSKILKEILHTVLSRK